MTGHEMSPTPSEQRPAITAALAAVGKLPAESGAPLRERVMKLVEKDADWELGSVLYEIARALLAEHQDFTSTTSWHTPLRPISELTGTLKSVAPRCHDDRDIPEQRLSTSGADLLDSADLVLSEARKHCGQNSALIATQSLVEMARGKYQLAADLAQQAAASSATPLHREAAQRNLVCALLLAGSAEAALEQAERAVREFGPSRRHVYNRALAHALNADEAAFALDAQALSEPGTLTNTDEPSSWRQLIDGQKDWIARCLRRKPSEVAAFFDWEALS